MSGMKSRKWDLGEQIVLWIMRNAAKFARPSVTELPRKPRKAGREG